MDFQKIVDGMTAMTCVVSVEKNPKEGRGKFKIVTGNRAYIDSIENPAPGTQMLTDKFTPDTEYTNYLTRDLNFEDACYSAAIEKKCLHSYAHPDRMNVWFNMMFIPLESDNDDLGYCLYMMEINFEASSENLSNISADTASSVLDTCIKLRGTNDFKATIKDVIKGIRELCAADHCCILTMNELDRTCEVLGESFGEGSKLLPMSTYLDSEFYDIADSWTATIAGSNCLIVKDKADMDIIKERNPVWYGSLTGAGVYNIVLFPLKSRNQLLGYIWALNYDKERAIKIKDTLEVTTFILGSELGNYMLLDRLRQIGSKDMLTGVMNRNEMNNFVDELSHGERDDESVGVIFADLNGLKAVNDADGHNAGDLLLKNASNILRRFFDEESIFRAGGDEFAIILTGVTQEDIDSKIEEIRKACDKAGAISFAIGGVVEKNCGNVRIALRRADEKMYEDKRKYYEQFPDSEVEDRRRRVPNASPAPAEGEEAERERNIFHEMNYDHLTGLPSMTYFFKLAESARRNMHEQNIPSALVFVNMTGLRFYNKKYGFNEGDDLIRALSKSLSKNFGYDCCSRFGQDHFAIFTEEKDIDKKLKRVFREMKTANGGKTLPVKAGIYLDDMGIVETSLACDRAKYACDSDKDDNRSGFVYYDRAMLQREINRQYIIDNIDTAIAENWVTAFYQPIVRTTGRKVCDEEALARWIDPIKGMMSPADFIPILEDTRLIYKVDLHIVDIILERMKRQMEKGITIVPVSVNLSRTDFECCDIVEEIKNRVDAAGVSRQLLTIEITESTVGENFEFMKQQISRFQELGFAVWMDDFGSGYSSLDLLQEIQFDLIKFDMRFMRQFETTPKSRVILTELMRMAISLGIETVTEGVETAEQVEFLSEIGCTKMQGYYFCKPISAEQLYERIEKGEQIGFEDPDESGYHKAMGDINLYDLGAILNEESESIKHYFNTIPMAVIESDGKTIKISRSNRSYREFVESYKKREQENKVSQGLLDAVSRCVEIGQKEFINETAGDGDMINAMIRKIAVNPVTGVAAYAVAVLGVIPINEQNITYTGVAKALSADYMYMYLVNTDTEEFTEYSPDSDNASISIERKGENFFEQSRKDALEYIYGPDRDQFIKVFTKENVMASIDESGAFTHSYRLIDKGETTYVNMKAVRLDKDDRRIIIGVNNVDTQMRQQEAIERMEAEVMTYSRISALMGDILAIYTVDPETSYYMEFSAMDEYSKVGASRAGTDFFADTARDAKEVVHPDDLDMVIETFTKENVLKKTKGGKVLKIRYRLKIGDDYVWVSLRAGRVEEKEGPQIIVGVSRSSV